MAVQINSVGESERVRLDKPVCFVTKYLDLKVCLKPKQVIYINKDRIEEPPLEAHFTNGVWFARFKDELDAAMKLITGPDKHKYTLYFRRAPSERELKVRADLEEEVSKFRAEATKKKIAEISKDPEIDIERAFGTQKATKVALDRSHKGVMPVAPSQTHRNGDQNE